MCRPMPRHLDNGRLLWQERTTLLSFRNSSTTSNLCAASTAASHGVLGLTAPMSVASPRGKDAHPRLKRPWFRSLIEPREKNSDQNWVCTSWTSKMSLNGLDGFLIRSRSERSWDY